jgi:hypothetical protein
VLDAFDQAGLGKPVSIPPLMHLPVVASQRPDVARRAEPLLKLFYEIRFGGRSIDRAERNRAEDAARSLKAAVRRKT